MSSAQEKAAALEWANEPTPRFAGGSPLVLGYEKGIVEVKEAVRKRLAYGGGGVTELKKDVRSMLSRSLGYGLQGRGLADGVQDASLSAARRLPDLQETIDDVLRLTRKKPGRKIVAENPGTRKSSLTKIQKKQVVELYRQGYSLKSIGERINRGTAAVSYFIKVNHIERRRNNGKG